MYLGYPSAHETGQLLVVSSRGISVDVCDWRGWNPGYVVALKESVLRELSRTMHTRDYVADQTACGDSRAAGRIRAAARRRHGVPVRAHDDFSGQDASVNATRAAFRAPVTGVAG